MPVAASVAAGALLAEAVAVTVAIEAGQASVAVAVESLAEPPALIPATAAVISAAVASSTRRFWEKMHPPSGSFTVSQVLPLPVLSEV